MLLKGSTDVKNEFSHATCCGNQETRKNQDVFVLGYCISSDHDSVTLQFAP